MEKTINQTLGFGVIGCGIMAEKVHCPNIKEINGAKTVAYCDLDESKAENLLQIFGGEYATTSAERILNDPSIDAVMIIVGPTVHARLVQAAAAAGKHIFVEKPIAIDLKDALETVRVVEESGVKFIHGTCNRLAPNVLRAKKMCPKPLYSVCQCADSITHQAVHNLDLAVNLFHQSQLTTIYASGINGWNIKEDSHLPVDSFSAVLTFADGSTHTYVQHGPSYNALLSKYSFQLFGPDRCIYLASRFKEVHEMTERNKINRSWSFEGEDTDRGPHGYMGHYEELQNLVDVIGTDGTGEMTVRDAAYVLAVEKAILHSVEHRQVVNFKEFLEQNEASFLLEGR
jgi:predicted dehydrogenase